MLFERLDAEIAPMRAAYEHYTTHPEEVEAILLRGAEKASAIATPFTSQLRRAVGLRNLSEGSSAATPAKATKVALASFKQYREKDGLFYFKLLAADGTLILQSTGFDQPKACGAAIARIQAEGASAVSALGQTLAEGSSADALNTAMAALREAKN